MRPLNAKLMMLRVHNRRREGKLLTATDFSVDGGVGFGSLIKDGIQG
jgi:hypothetical protein